MRISLWQGNTFEVVMYPVHQFFPRALGVQTCYSRQYHVDNFSADDFCHFVKENKMYSHLLLVPPHSSVVLHFLLKQSFTEWSQPTVTKMPFGFPHSFRGELSQHCLLRHSVHGKCSVQHRSTNQSSLILIISSWITHSLVFCTLRCSLWHDGYLQAPGV